MSDFKQAIEWLKEGKKVRHPRMGFDTDHYFLKGAHIYHCRSEEPWEGGFTFNEYEATDWEIYEEKESDGDLFNRLGTDGKLWAEEFMKLFENKKDKIDEGLMIGWFCNAIEAGRNAK